MEDKSIYDCIIIGAGPGGVQAGLYLSRANKRVLVCHSPSLGSLNLSKVIENYYGTGKVSAQQLYRTGIEQLRGVGAEIAEGLVVSVKYDYVAKIFEVTSESKSFVAKTLIVATGREQAKNTSYVIEAKQGVSYCAICDGFFYRNKKVAVIGESEFAFAEINHLLDVTSNIDVLLNGKTAKMDTSKLKNVIKTKIQSLVQNDKNGVSVVFADGKQIEYDGVFVAEGNLGASSLAKILGLATDKQGYIIVDENMMTSADGVFACGDVIGGVAQIAKAVNDGMNTGLSVINYLNKHKNLQ